MVLQKKQSNIIISFLLFFYLLLVIRSAWISDDAMITFRTVENFLAGYGLGYNPYVRVQAFTHPLWMFAISFLYYLFQFIFPYSISGLFNVVFLLSFGCSFASVYLLLTKISKTGVLSLILASLMLFLSSSFIDFSTSGLENPLTHLLLVLFIWIYYRYPGNLVLLFFFSALIALNRLDAFLLIFPAIIYIWFTSERKPNQIYKLLIGFAPLILWEMFSLFYYGFLFPNTAYAKLNTGIDNFLLVQQGLDYFLNTVNWSPITIFSIVTVVFLTQYLQKKTIALYFGVLIYLLYILTIGGDFMSGRFFSAPLIISVAIISLEIKSRKNQLVLIFVVLLLGCFSFRSPLIASNANLYYSNFPVFDGNGIADERLFYINPNRNKGFVENGFLNPGYYSKFAGEKWYFVGFKKVVVADLLGETGYMKGPNFYLTDHYALSDPLLARLPIQNKNWRIGHFYRDFPEGYLDTLGTNENMIVDPELALYYSKLKTIISGPILDWQRVIEIWKFNTGQYDYLMESYLSRIKN